MDLLCYIQPDWAPRIRPAVSRRAWMDATPDSFAYRCLPLAIANAHGWEVLSPCGFEACWDGGQGTNAVQIKLDPDTDEVFVPVSLFGSGVLTFHVEGLFRTDPGWNLWVTGPPNLPKDAIIPLSGMIETDWSPYTFTMNWRFTRPGEWVRFDENEPICFFFPIDRKAVEGVEPKLLPLAENEALKAQFESWSASRVAFHERMDTDRRVLASESWQKSYYRGINPDGSPGRSDHQSKLRVSPFRLGDGSALEPPAAKAQPLGGDLHSPDMGARGDASGAYIGGWLLETLEQQRMLSATARAVHLRQALSSQQFLDDYYAPSRPVLIAGELASWPALRLWRPSYLAEKVGGASVVLQEHGLTFGAEQAGASATMPFDTFIGDRADATTSGARIASSEMPVNRAAFASLWDDVGHFDKFLDGDEGHDQTWLTIALAGAFTPLHFELRNVLHAQLMGHQRLILLPPSETPKLSVQSGTFSEIRDISDTALDVRRFPKAASARKMELVLNPGDVLYIPVGWWIQSSSVDLEASVKFTGFKWPNEAHLAFPRT